MQFNVGDIVEGKITGIKEYGVFADIGEGKSGMVHISEVANTYVNDINEFCKVGDTFKMKILSVSEEGKISLSIKKAQDNGAKNDAYDKKPREKRVKPKPQAPVIDSSYVWTPQKSESSSFEEMMNRFKATSDEKISDLKRKNVEAKRARRGGAK